MAKTTRRAEPEAWESAAATELAQVELTAAQMGVALEWARELEYSHGTGAALAMAAVAAAALAKWREQEVAALAAAARSDHRGEAPGE